jgi:peptidoglycan/LPS O-acetylase OafA/YrhL
MPGRLRIRFLVENRQSAIGTKHKVELRCAPPSAAQAHSPGSERLIGLDLLRLLAVVLVLICHLCMIPGMPRAITPLTHYGSLGVGLFFVLSGFLVSGLMFGEYRRTGEINLKRFYVRRAWKIYPSFYLMIVFSYLFSLLALNWKMRDRAVFSELFFLQSYIEGYWNHTWSLAVEEHFYIGLPLCLLLLRRTNRLRIRPFIHIPRILAIALPAFCALRMLNYAFRMKYAFLTHVFATHLRLDSLLFGVGIAYYYHFHHEEFVRVLRPWRYALIMAAAGVIWARRLVPLGGADQHLYTHTLGFVHEYLGSGMLMTGAILCQIPRNWLSTSLARLGSYSYSIYLWHMATIFWLTPHLQLPWGALAAIYLAGAFIIGVGMAHLWELPMLKVRDKLFPAMVQRPSGSTELASAGPSPTESATPVKIAA